MKWAIHREELLALTLALTAASATLSMAEPALAQKKAPARAPALDTDALRKDLESGDDERVVRALERIRDAGSAAKALAPQLDALLRRGPTAKSCVPALEAAGAVEVPVLSPAIAPFVRHRAPPVRRAATAALQRSGGPDAVRALRLALRSSDAVVRALAATGLGKLGAKEALADLLNALDRGLPEAGAAFARLCDSATCEKLLERVGGLPFEVMRGGCEELLFRASAEMPDDAKIRLIDRIVALGSQEAAAYLGDVAARWPPAASRRVKQALDEAAKAMAARPPKDSKR